MLFLESYKAIPKTGRVVCLDKAKRVTPAELEKREAAAYREAHNGTYLAGIQTLWEAGAISPKSMKRIRALDRQRGRDYTASDVSALIAELDSHLEAAVKNVV
jgi:hypothetical protein